jgi:glycosyltransferase involved in cell wall biosynthesis
MKVFHLSDHLPGFHEKVGGAEQVAFRYIKLLADSKKVKILVGITKPKNMVEENFTVLRIRTIEDLFPEKYHIYITGVKNRILSFDPLSFVHLLYILKKYKPNVIHFHKINKISFSSILAAKLLNIKIIMGVYDYWYFCPAGMLITQGGNLCTKFHGSWCKDCDAVSDFRLLLPFVSVFRKPIFDYFYNFVDGFAVLSKAQSKLIEQYGISKKKIFLIRQVFNFKPTIQYISKKTDNYILFAGWLDQRKGLHILIEAMPKILKSFPKLKLNILKLEGMKSYEDMISKRISKLKLGDNINILGRLTKEEFQNYLLNASVIAVPEQWENMSPVIVVEGMSYGKTIVASNIGGIPEFISDGKNGLLVERDNPDDWAQKITWAIKNQKDTQKLGEQAKRDIAILCNQKKILNNMLKLYKEI